MTIEGRPELNVDWDLEYSKQRKSRMQDAIDDYLQDDKADSRLAYEDILSCVDDVIKYHRGALDKATTLKSLMMGHREIDFIDEYNEIPKRF